MIIYNQAFDLYHTIFRILHLINRFENEQMIEVDRIRIWDFYLLFPDKIRDIKLKKDESDIRKLRKRFIAETNNPYEFIAEERKVFEKIKVYQLSALNCISSYGFIDQLSLTQERVVITNKVRLSNFVDQLGTLTPKENNVISLMTSHFYKMSLFGANGLKNRTNLMESKYDAQ